MMLRKFTKSVLICTVLFMVVIPALVQTQGTAQVTNLSCTGLTVSGTSHLYYVHITVNYLNSPDDLAYANAFVQNNAFSANLQFSTAVPTGTHVTVSVNEFADATSHAVPVSLGQFNIVTNCGGSTATLSALALCGPYDKLGTCSPRFTNNQQVKIRSGVPFIWLRFTPSSSGEVNTTVVGSSQVILFIVNGAPVWDNYQWWWQVGLSSQSRNGWVEQASLVEVTANVPSNSYAPYPAYENVKT